jgi:hypothetical protein
MKIISKFKDYYDWVAQRYGGGDPLNVWIRQDTVNKIEGLGLDYTNLKIPYVGLSPTGWSSTGSEWGWNLKFCVLNGRAYPLVQKWITTDRYKLEKTKEPFRVLRENDPFIDFYLSSDNTGRYGFLRRKEQINLWLEPKQSNTLIKAHQALKQPAFMIVNPEEASGRLPRLGELGFAAIFSAEQAYQNLSYFVGNYLRDSADLNPPAAVSDRDRIVQHGFDLKKSFRH